MFVATFDRLSKQPLGFSAERLLALDTVVQGVGQRHVPAVYWEQIADHLRTVPGVEKVALAEWALMDGWGYQIRFHFGQRVRPRRPSWESFLSVTPGWFDTMRIPLLDGRDFRADDIYINPDRKGCGDRESGVCSEIFPRRESGGKIFRHRRTPRDWRDGYFEIVGLVGDARLSQRHSRADRTGDLQCVSLGGGRGLGACASPGDIHGKNHQPESAGSGVRFAQGSIARAAGFLRFRNIRTQQELIEMHTIRERLLAMLALFFSGVAVLLAGVGMYGVLDYSVMQRRREIGIRMAIGAQAGDIARRVTAEIFAMVLAGAAAGVAIGMASARSVETLLYGVKPTDIAVVAVPALTILLAALLAALPAAIRAVRIDPVAMLRAE